MIRHLLKLVWRRKATNLLLIVEILLSFVVVLVVTTVSLQFWTAYRCPLGFTTENVWELRVLTRGEKDLGGFRQVWEALRSAPEIEAVSRAHDTPYSTDDANSGFTTRGREVLLHTIEADDAFARVVGLTLVRGRWFDATDDGAARKPLVLTEDAAREVFGDADPIGRAPTDDGKFALGDRVVGVVRTFRKRGELDATVPYAFGRIRPDDEYGAFLLKVRPGTPFAFEQELVRRLEEVARKWAFQVTPFTDIRQKYLYRRLLFPALGAVVAAFMITMVVLGLTGVLWQNVTQRTREIGLRRAAGATPGAVLRQILGELIILAVLAVSPGIVLAVQVPWLLSPGAVETGPLAASLAFSTALIVALVTVCGLYPGYVAVRVHPAEALRYE